MCGGKTTTAHPARFSPEDAYGEYRRRLKRLDADKAKANTSANTNVKPNPKPNATAGAR